MRSVFGTILLLFSVGTLHAQATSSGTICKTMHVVVGPSMEAATNAKGAVLLKEMRWDRPHTSAIVVNYKKIRSLRADEKGLINLDGLNVGEYEVQISLPDGEARGSVDIPKNRKRADCTSELVVWQTPHQLEIGSEICGPFSQSPCPCEGESVRPNLRVYANSRVHGWTRDRSGAAFSNTKMEIRDLLDSGAESLIATAQTDSDGAFDFGVIKPGQYRFVVNSRAWTQPSDLRCLEKSDCLLNLTIDANPSDLPYAHCPVK